VNCSLLVVLSSAERNLLVFVQEFLVNSDSQRSTFLAKPGAEFGFCLSGSPDSTNPSLILGSEHLALKSPFRFGADLKSHLDLTRALMILLQIQWWMLGVV
jgi:hypothetical protein